VINEQGIIQHWNSCATSTFHYSAEDAIGQNISFLMPEPHRSHHDSYLRHYLTTGERRVIGKPRDVPIVTARGEALICSLKVSCLFDARTGQLEVRGGGRLQFSQSSLKPSPGYLPSETLAVMQCAIGERDECDRDAAVHRPFA
jgi:PAS domain S-box-containing protein